MRCLQTKEAKEQLLLRMLNSWLTPANPEYQAAVSSIEVVFSDSPNVLRKRDSLIAHVSNEAAERQNSRIFAHAAREKQAELLAAMGEASGIKMDDKQLLQAAYLTKAFVRREELLHEAFASWPRIARSLEEANANTQRIIAAASAEAGKNN
ncbi:DUF6680 family protein [Leisingera daeponensis]|uniref:DUF6680 family protein n=1 Tax=Leisingera daeponensis TaxID=405746 RepID=UPI00316AD9D3